MAQALDVLRQLAPDPRGLIWLSRLHAQTAHELRLRLDRIADDVRARDTGAAAGIDVEHERGAIGIVLDDRRCSPNVSFQIPLLAIEIFERSGNVGGTADWWRLAEPLRHPIAQHRFRYAERSAEFKRELRVDGLQQITDVHRSARAVLGLDLHVVKPAETVEVCDGCPDVRDRERAALACRDEREELRFQRRPSLDGDGDIFNGTSNVRGCGHAGLRRAGSLRLGGARERGDERQQDDRGETHQKIWRRTLKSTENVRSPFCVSTQPKLWL